MRKHFVTFFSPGTFVSEETTKQIDSWDIDTAVDMAAKIRERYGARPYGFQFSTRERGPDDFDSRETETSPIHYIGGKVETIDDVRKRADPEERILLFNMEGNGWDRIIVNDNSSRVVRPFLPTDIILDVQLPRIPRDDQ
jgi:hypothetical protein